MDIGWSAEDTSFRDEVRRGICELGRPGWSQRDFELHTAELQAECRRFCSGLAARGLLTPSWPAEYGGRDASAWEQVILSEEMHAAWEPRGPQYMNVNWIGPAIMAFGTPAQRAQHLPLISTGQVFWCQGFSEPDAGSDLASLRTSATRDGDYYVVNGQKIWTSYAHVADYCFLLVRTDRTSSGSRGISILLMPTDLDGIEIRDIPNVSGEHVIHEIFLKNVRVPAECRLGEEGQAWSIIRQALANERIGIARYQRSERVLDEVMERYLCGPTCDPESAAEAAGAAFAINEAARVLNYVAVGERIDEPSGRRACTAISRVATADAVRAVADAGRDILGPGTFSLPSLDQQIVTAITTPIAAGTYEVQLDLVARDSLELPKTRRSA